MKTKILNAVLCLLCIIGLASCGALAPEHAEDDDVLCYVYDETRENSTSDVGENFLLAYLDELSGLFGKQITDQEKIYNTKMLDWEFSEDWAGDDYWGYYITYEVNVKKGDNTFTYYSLVELKEFDNDTYQPEVLYVSDDLSEIQDLLN